MQVRNEVKELRLLFEVLQILDSASDLSDNLETVLEVMAEHTGMMRGVITLLDERHGEIAIEAAYGMSPEAQSRGRYKLGEGITGKVVESGKPLVIPNVLVEPLFLNRTGSRGRKEAVSFVCVPIKMEGRVIGALSADRLFAESEALEEDMRLLTVLASLVAKAVRNRQEHHRMLEENRRLLDVLLEQTRPGMFVGTSPGLRPCSPSLRRWPPRAPRSSCWAKAARARNLSPKPFMRTARERDNPWFASTARLCRTDWRKANCSDMKKARLPARPPCARAALRQRPEGRFFLMK